MPYEKRDQATAQGVAYIAGESAAEVLARLDPDHWGHGDLFFKESVNDAQALYGESAYKVTIIVERT